MKKNKKITYSKEDSLRWRQSLDGVSYKEIVKWAMKQPFPGNSKWEAKNPIWDSYLPGCKSPREAWKDKELLTAAVQNMFWIVNKDLEGEHRYADFDEDHINNMHERNERFAQQILARFTIAKIAPKVTALRASDMLKILEESNIDISNGVYAPMAGFGGIIEAAKRWGKKHKIKDFDEKIEAYDINQNFCDYYGWTQRDMLAQVVKTKKTCIVCPPFGKAYEHWDGTPDRMSDITFIEWYNLIKKYVKAPNYIIIGPEIDYTGTGRNKGYDADGNSRNGLFTKTVGIMQWEDDMYKHFKNDPEARKKAGIKDN